jgi:flagellar operon protein
VSTGLNPALLPADLRSPAAVDPASVDRGARIAVGGPGVGGRESAGTRASDQPAPSFAQVLEDAGRTAGARATSAPGGDLRFSKHALERAQRRGITLDPATMSRLSEGVGRAAGKGSRDSVVLVDGTAFVVSVDNRTVVTAVGSEHMREHVFTNVDSAVIA